MSLTANLQVGATPVLAISGFANCRGIDITNNGVGTGNVFFQMVDHLPLPAKSTTTLTTANGTKLIFQPNPTRINLTPDYAAQYPGLNPSSPSISDDSDGFDLYLISDGSAQVSVKTVPI
jgi:hypothetical protein